MRRGECAAWRLLLSRGRLYFTGFCWIGGAHLTACSALPARVIERISFESMVPGRHGTDGEAMLAAIESRYPTVLHARVSGYPKPDRPYDWRAPALPDLVLRYRSVSAAGPIAQRDRRIEDERVHKSVKQKRMHVAVGYILVSVVAGAVGQILLRRDGSMGPLAWSGAIAAYDMEDRDEPYVLVACHLHGGVLFWLAALSRVDLSYAIPSPA